MHKLVSPFKNYSRASFDLHEDWFIFLLPQSVFKVHPLYDSVMVQILAHHHSVHLVVTGGRRKRWTEVYKQRLMKSVLANDKSGTGTLFCPLHNADYYKNFLACWQRLTDCILLKEFHPKSLTVFFRSLTLFCILFHLTVRGRVSLLCEGIFQPHVVCNFF